MDENADDARLPDGTALRVGVGKSRWRSFQPDVEGLETAGYASIAGCWTLFQPDGNPARIQNTYLRERFTGDWAPRFPGRDVPLEVRGWSASTSKGAADRLANFLNWMDAAGYDWRTITYAELLQYQTDMVKGFWARSRPFDAGLVGGANPIPLTNNVANGRADEGTFFLLWAAETGHRGQFDVPTRLVKVKRWSGVERPTWIRSHRLKPNPSHLKLKQVPTVPQVRLWEDAIRKDKGRAKALNCRFIVRTAVRLEEGTSVRVGQWPSTEVLDERATLGYVSIPLLLSVTKGGTPRFIDVPLDLAVEVRDYIDTSRLVAQLRFMKREKKEASDLLFLSDARGFEGTPIRRQSVYRCFKKKVAGGPKDWHPHMARHFYACQHILDAVRTDAKILGQDVALLGVDWVAARAGYHLELLRQQLGHQEASTTKIYLKWLLTALGLAGVTSSWMRKLDAGGDHDAA